MNNPLRKSKPSYQGIARSTGRVREVPVVHLADLADPDAAEQELRWFFGPALGEIEGGSNYQPMVARLAPLGKARAHRTAPQADTRADRRADALRTARSIYERLCKLPDAQRRLLQSVFRPAGATDRALPEAVDAIDAYEDVRGGGPSVVPINEEEEE